MSVKDFLFSRMTFLKWYELDPEEVRWFNSIEGLTSRVFMSPDVHSLHLCWITGNNWIQHEIADYYNFDDPFDLLEQELFDDAWQTWEAPEHFYKENALTFLFENLFSDFSEYSENSPPPVIRLGVKDD